jgi:hypothetical protein
MKRLIAVFLCLLFPVVAFASDSNSYKVGYDGVRYKGSRLVRVRTW